MVNRTAGFVALAICLLLFGNPFTARADESGIETKSGDEPLPATIDFNEHIRPLFNAHCVACHGGVKQAGEISFVYKEQVLPPDGWIVEPGDPDASSLIERVKETDPDLRMPPPEHGAALSQYEIGLLTKWIEQGAIWKTGHWAYTAPEERPIPEVTDSAWVRRPMDQFVLAKLDAKKLKPSQDAGPERWLRRVTLDLTGLPPTLAERDAFLAAFRQDAVAARSDVVERLLQSPGYGERWASVWLDQIRYADSKGLGLDGRRTVWKYRDWVIDAMNRDMPYDEFTIKQIAGDLLPNPSIEDLVATAAHRVTQTNEEGGTDDEEFRIAAVLDRVNTTWQAWEGVTFGCVQCHSHPYDPFRHEEYYRFAAFFNGTSDCDLNEDWPTAEAPLDSKDYPLASELDGKIRSLREQIWRREYPLLNDNKFWTPMVQMKASTNNQTRVTTERVGDHDEFHTVDTVSQNTDITISAPMPDGLSTLTAIRFTAMPLNPEQAVSDSEWGFVLSGADVSLVVDGEDSPRPIEIERLISDEADPFFDPQSTLDAKSNRGFSAYTRISQPRQAALILKQPLDIPAGASLQMKLSHRVSALGAFPLVTKRGHLAVTDDDRFTQLLSDSEIVAMRQDLADLGQRRRGIPSVSIPIMQELPEHLQRPQHVFERGLFLTKGDLVTAGTPASLPPLPEGKPDRLALAKWLVAPENPLTARVAVNRVWSQLFGIGLVATEEDFGSSGDVPSHPALLDYLALRFQNEFGWSMKDLLREIVLSHTYAQSSKVTAELYELDPLNRLLARGPRFRLSSEMVRDQALALSGLLNDKQFGPPVHPPIPDGVWNPFSGGDKWATAGLDNEDRYRRSIYTYMKRSIPYPMYSAFDAPSREFCAPRRLRSNTPIQALTMLNDQTFAESTTALASRMKEFDDDPVKQIRHGFLIVTCREPADAELQALKNLYDQIGGDDRSDGITAVAAVLLNLDEVVMK
ncbi:MAG: PSD1 domain-containing protein [Planctomycetales bacterium]|nr:PSD1 domain-containing protein [Planctomycetales bacterium]